MGTVNVRSGYVRDLLQNVTTISDGVWQYKDAPKAAIQATVTGTGTVTATVNIEYSNDGVNPCATLGGTITLSGTNSASDGFTSDSPWKWIRANVAAVSGTGATVNSLMSV
jgi:hypothetical protein